MTEKITPKLKRSSLVVSRRRESAAERIKISGSLGLFAPIDIQQLSKNVDLYDALEGEIENLFPVYLSVFASIFIAGIALIALESIELISFGEGDSHQ